MLRSLNGKILKSVFDHQVLHDLSSWSSEEIAYVFLLMSIAGNHCSPNASYGFNGAMQICFPDAESAISALRSRGYLANDLPLSCVMEDVKIPELKELLKTHNMTVSGSRSVLLEKLMPVLSSSDISRIKSIHSRWFPSAYGFEILYSFYYLWDMRLASFLNALIKHDIACINKSRDALLSCIPYQIGMGFNGYSEIRRSEVIHIGSEAEALDFIRRKYFRPEFYLRGV